MIFNAKVPSEVYEIATSDDTEMTVQLVKRKYKDDTSSENVLCITLCKNTGSGDDGSQTTVLTERQTNRLINTLAYLYPSLIDDDD